MLTIRQLERVIKGPAGLLICVVGEIFSDALVLGIVFTAGTKAVLLLTIALSV